MRKELKILFSNWWQLISYLLILTLIIFMGITTTTDNLLVGLDPKEIAAVEGPYDKEKLDDIWAKYEGTPYSYGLEEYPHVVLEHVYGDEYLLDRERLQKIAEQRPQAAAKAHYLLDNLQFFYTTGWETYLAVMASAPRQLPVFSFYMAGLLVLGAGLLGDEYQLGTWLVIGNTPYGRRGTIGKKFCSLILTGLVSMLLVQGAALSNLARNSGSFAYANRPISEMLNTVPLWDTSLLGAVLLNMLFWLLALLLLSSTILLISALVKKGLLVIILGLIWLLGVPKLLNLLTPLRPLFLPLNLASLEQIFQSPGIDQDCLVQFLKYRPWLPASAGAVLAYVILVSLLLTALMLKLTQVAVRRWY